MVLTFYHSFFFDDENRSIALGFVRCMDSTE